MRKKCGRAQWACFSNCNKLDGGWAWLTNLCDLYLACGGKNFSKLEEVVRCVFQVFPEELDCFETGCESLWPVVGVILAVAVLVPAVAA